MANEAMSTANSGPPSDDESWERYYRKTGDRPPRATLLFALDRFDHEPEPDGRRFAIDLGCGNGRDTVELLRRGWRVLGIDAEPKAIEGLRARTDLPKDAVLDTMVSRFEDAALPEAELVNSSFALPLVPPRRFPELWDGILAALRSGGRVSCQLYGDRDGWVGRPGMTFFTRGGIEALIEPLDVELFREEEDDSVTPRGQAKHWHIYHIVARKP
jgi:SAM-dependent methyltransferase